MKRKRGGASSTPEFAAKPPVNEYMMLLFETPSGFAVFHFPGSLINRCLEEIWTYFSDVRRAKSVVSLQEFQTFKDKSSAIDKINGVNEKLTSMMIRNRLRGMQIAVGKPEYKKIIEVRLGIVCLYNPAVMEVMWGIQNWMPSLVPREKSQLAEEDRLPMSKGLQEVLERYGCNVKPEMVNEQIVATAYALFRCDYVENGCSLALRKAGDIIKEVSGISCEGWSLLKIATALKMIWQPEKVGDSCGVSNLQELRLAMDARRYELRLVKPVCLRIYEQMVEACDVRTSKKELLKSLVERVPRAGEAEDDTKLTA